MQCFSPVVEAIQTFEEDSEATRQLDPFLKFLERAADVLGGWISCWEAKKISMSVIQQLMEDKGNNLREVSRALKATGLLEASMPTAATIEAWHKEAKDFTERVVDYTYPKCKECTTAGR